jgi:enamine deaminase RidA (YjgF/YER057c/UK114 family)
MIACELRLALNVERRVPGGLSPPEPALSNRTVKRLSAVPSCAFTKMRAAAKDRVADDPYPSPIEQRSSQPKGPAMSLVVDRLKDLGIRLPPPARAVANYVGFVRVGDQLVVSGQLCLVDGVLVAKGKLGADVTVDEGQAAARVCAINLLAQVAAALGDLDRVKRVVRLGGFVNSAPGFLEGAVVMNGASDLMVAVFGENGRHARSAVGVATLPGGAAVEVEGTFEVA